MPDTPEPVALDIEDSELGTTNEVDLEEHDG